MSAANPAADRLLAAQRLVGELTDLLDDFGSLNQLQRLSFTSARNHAAAN